MRLVATHSIEPGTRLGKTVYNEENGQILIQQNVKLTKQMLKRLLHYNITYIYIKDSLTDDIEVNFPITDELRREASQTIKASFQVFQKEGIAKHSYVFEKTGEKMAYIVSGILDQIQKQEKVVSILSDVFITDDYIFAHSLNVTIYTLALGTEIGLSRLKLEELGLGAMLHDVGKVFIPAEVLHKEGPLTDEEYEIIKSHTESGFNFLRKIPAIPLLAAHCAFQHHERLDGSGYPRGLVNKEIHFYAKLIGIADVFDAVTSDRIYRSAMLPHEGLEMLYAGAGELFDKRLVEEFRRTIAVYPNGLTVELSDGRKGIVARQNKHISERPVIRILKDNEKDRAVPYEVDLSQVLNLTIVSCDTTFEGKVK